MQISDYKKLSRLMRWLFNPFKGPFYYIFHNSSFANAESKMLIDMAGFERTVKQIILSKYIASTMLTLVTVGSIAANEHGRLPPKVFTFLTATVSDMFLIANILCDTNCLTLGHVSLEKKEQVDDKSYNNATQHITRINTMAFIFLFLRFACAIPSYSTLITSFWKKTGAVSTNTWAGISSNFFLLQWTVHGGFFVWLKYQRLTYDKHHGVHIKTEDDFLKAIFSDALRHSSEGLNKVRGFVRMLYQTPRMKSSGSLHDLEANGRAFGEDSGNPIPGVSGDVVPRTRSVTQLSQKMKVDQLESDDSGASMESAAGLNGSADDSGNPLNSSDQNECFDAARNLEFINSDECKKLSKQCEQLEASIAEDTRSIERLNKDVGKDDAAESKIKRREREEIRTNNRVSLAKIRRISFQKSYNI